LGRCNVPQHAHQEVLNELEPRDRLAKLHALGCVTECVLIGASPAADCEPRHAGSRHSQHIGGVAETVGVLQPVRFRHPAILERDQTILDHPQRHLVLDLLDREAGIVLADDKAFDLAGAFVACPNDINVGERGITNPLFLTIEHPGVAFAPAGRHHSAGRGRANQRLSETERTDLLKAHHGG
jgi:hypothetical protein